MRPNHLILTLSILASFSLISCNKSSSSSNNDKIAKEVDRICDSVLANSKLPGMVVGIWDGTKGFTYLKGKGYMNLSPKDTMQPTASFRIGSNTKTFVNTAILELVDAGQLSLDDTLGKFFPGYTNGSIVTIRMLCNMTSGIYNYTETEAFANAITANPLKVWTPQELIDLVKDSAFKHPPGSVVYYSNTNTTMLGIIVQNLTGDSLADDLKQRFFTRLSLNNTYLPMDNHMAIGGIRGYTIDSLGNKTDETEKYNATWAWAAGGIISNVNEVRTWVTQLVTGNLLSAGLQAKRFEGGASSGLPGVTYGLGMFTRGHDMWGHNGGMAGYTSIMMHHKTKDITYVIFYNTQDEALTPDALFARLLPVVNPEL